MMQFQCTLAVNDDVLAHLGDDLDTYLNEQAAKAARHEGAQTSGPWTFKRVGVDNQITTYLATCDLGAI